MGQKKRKWKKMNAARDWYKGKRGGLGEREKQEERARERTMWEKVEEIVLDPEERRRKKQMRKKNEKNRTERSEKKVLALLFVPQTPGGELAKLIQKVEDKNAKMMGTDRVRVVERGGTELKEMLCKNNPFGRQKCLREDCQVCHGKYSEGKQAGKCLEEGITYKISCMECKMEGKKTNYWGESSRTLYERYGEHLDKKLKKKEDSALWKHEELWHNGEEVEFRPEVIQKHMKPLTRQIQEGVLILKSEDDIILNSKSEWNMVPIPRIVTEKRLNEEERDLEGKIEKKLREEREKIDKGKEKEKRKNEKKRERKEKVKIKELLNNTEGEEPLITKEIEEDHTKPKSKKRRMTAADFFFKLNPKPLTSALLQPSPNPPSKQEEIKEEEKEVNKEKALDKTQGKEDREGKEPVGREKIEERVSQPKEEREGSRDENGEERKQEVEESLQPRGDSGLVKTSQKQMSESESKEESNKERKTMKGRRKSRKERLVKVENERVLMDQWLNKIKVRSECIDSGLEKEEGRKEVDREGRKKKGQSEYKRKVKLKISDGDGEMNEKEGNPLSTSSAEIVNHRGVKLQLQSKQLLMTEFVSLSKGKENRGFKLSSKTPCTQNQKCKIEMGENENLNCPFNTLGRIYHAVDSPGAEDGEKTGPGPDDQGTRDNGQD